MIEFLVSQESYLVLKAIRISDGLFVTFCQTFIPFLQTAEGTSADSDSDVMEFIGRLNVLEQNFTQYTVLVDGVIQVRSFMPRFHLQDSSLIFLFRIFLINTYPAE